MATRILLVRHGQTTSNVEDRIRGQIDVPLDETGRWQAQQTAAYIAERWPLKAVYASPMSRVLDTAGAIAGAQGLVAHTVVNRVILCAVLGLDNDHFWQFVQGTCAINVIEGDLDMYFLKLMNDTSHLWRSEGA